MNTFLQNKQLINILKKDDFSKIDFKVEMLNPKEAFVAITDLMLYQYLFDQSLEQLLTTAIKNSSNNHTTITLENVCQNLLTIEIRTFIEVTVAKKSIEFDLGITDFYFLHYFFFNNSTFFTHVIKAGDPDNSSVIPYLEYVNRSTGGLGCFKRIRSANINKYGEIVLTLAHSNKYTIKEKYEEEFFKQLQRKGNNSLYQKLIKEQKAVNENKEKNLTELELSAVEFSRQNRHSTIVTAFDSNGEIVSPATSETLYEKIFNFIHQTENTIHFGMELDTYNVSPRYAQELYFNVKYLNMFSKNASGCIRGKDKTDHIDVPWCLLIENISQHLNEFSENIQNNISPILLKYKIENL